MVKAINPVKYAQIKQSVINEAVEDQTFFGTSYIFIPDDTKEKPRNVSLKEIYNLK